MKVFFCTLLLASSLCVRAGVMPNLVDVPGDWIPTNPAPAGFANIGTFAGRDNVLALTTNGSVAAAFQGITHATNGGLGSILSADLYISSAWGTSSGSSVEASLWGQVRSANGALAPYGIIGFTNAGGTPRLHAWTWDWEAYMQTPSVFAYSWRSLDNAITYDAWNTLSIRYTAEKVIYSINDRLAYADLNLYKATKISEVGLRSYSYQATAGGKDTAYTAYWANSVPEFTSTLGLFTLALASLTALRRRRG